VVGLKANASTLPPDQLDKLDHLDEGKPEAFAALMSGLHAGGYKVLGGCCGTSDAHIRALARRLTAERTGR
jgi:methionine synthase I (cobalamin-dependent)